jgi:N-acetylneuraminate synthase
MSKVVIIAEAGVNHNGNIQLAKDLIQTAKDCGADFVKFQTWKTDNIVTRFAKQAEYQELNTGKSESQYDMLKRLELGFNEFKELKSYCDVSGIAFLSTPDDWESAVFLSDLQDTFKIGSGEINNIPFLEKIGTLNKNIYLSTGMSTIEEIQNALNALTSAGLEKSRITLLHCTSQYPAPFSDINLRAMQSLGEYFDIEVGYSDHSLGLEVSLGAVALGARVIEKHFTLNKTMAGPDHSASLNPEELKKLVFSIRNLETSLGDGKKKIEKSEIENRLVVRKSIVANKQIQPGEIFTESNLSCKRPGDGMSPSNWHKIIGRAATQKYEIDDQISERL